jgi:predicted RNase H-like HicB family nuclease
MSLALLHQLSKLDLAGFEVANWRRERRGTIFLQSKEIVQMDQPIIVSAIWDAETKVWIAESYGVPGLATGAETLEELVEKLKIAIPELLSENGIAFEADRLLFKIEAERSEFASVAA